MLLSASLCECKAKPFNQSMGPHEIALPFFTPRCDQHLSKALIQCSHNCSLHSQQKGPISHVHWSGFTMNNVLAFCVLLMDNFVKLLLHPSMHVVMHLRSPYNTHFLKKDCASLDLFSPYNDFYDYIR